ncbi:MAG: fumarate hydratase [Candidatus Odinarchaeia archaeon]
MNLIEVIEKTAFNLIKTAVTKLPQDVKNAIKNAYSLETNELAKIQLEAILNNISLAERETIPICQDTGTPTFYIKVGSKFQLAKIERALKKAVIRATREVPLRPNAIHPISNKNTGNNIGLHVPIIHWEITEGEDLELTFLAKGGGSENTCALRMLTPSEGLEGVKKFVLETVVKAGGKPCPPIIIGIGIGGGADLALKLAKKAILRPLNRSHKNKKVAALERELLNAVNSLGIGPMGIGGKITSLAVHIEYAHRHPASFPVGIVTQCWAHRVSSARIKPNGDIIYLTNY